MTSFTISPDPSITYHNPFENTIFRNPSNNMSQPADVPDLQRFTATGRPIPAQDTRTGLSGGMASAHSYGQSAPNLLPVRFTDNSVISVPVLPHAEPSQTKPDDEDSDEGPVKGPKSRSRFSLSNFRRKSSSSGNGKQSFVIKEMTRGNYLKHYAKDDSGKYIGSEEPASDCILNNEEDRIKWRRA